MKKSAELEEFERTPDGLEILGKLDLEQPTGAPRYDLPFDESLFDYMPVKKTEAVDRLVHRLESDQLAKDIFGDGLDVLISQGGAFKRIGRCDCSCRKCMIGKCDACEADDGKKCARFTQLNSKKAIGAVAGDLLQDLMKAVCDIDPSTFAKEQNEKRLERYMRGLSPFMQKFEDRYTRMIGNDLSDVMVEWMNEMHRAMAECVNETVATVA